MIVPQKYQCELCGVDFEKPSDVRDEIAVVNGANSRAYAYVCSPCITKFVEMVDEQFPKSKYAVRKREAERVAGVVAERIAATKETI